MSAVATAAAATATSGARRSPTSGPPTSPSGHDDRATALARALACWTAHRRSRAMRRLMAEGGDGDIDDPHRPQRRRPLARRRRGGGRRAAQGGAAGGPRTPSGRCSTRCSPTPPSPRATGARRWRRPRRIVRARPTGAGSQPGRRAARARRAGRRPATWRRWSRSRRRRRPRRASRAGLVTPRPTSASVTPGAAEHVLGATADAGPLLVGPRRAHGAARPTGRRPGPSGAARQLLVTRDRRAAPGRRDRRGRPASALAEVQFLLGDGEAAMGALDELAPILHRHAMARREAAAQTTVGRIAWSVGETDVAVSCLERARRIDPTRARRRSRRPARLARS